MSSGEAGVLVTYYCRKGHWLARVVDAPDGRVVEVRRRAAGVPGKRPGEIRTAAGSQSRFPVANEDLGFWSLFVACRDCGREYALTNHMVMDDLTARRRRVGLDATR